MANLLGSAIINDGAICYSSLNNPWMPELITRGTYKNNINFGYATGPTLPYHDVRMMYSTNDTTTTPFPHFDFGIAEQVATTSKTLTFEAVFMTDYTNYDLGGSSWGHPIFVFYTDWASFTVGLRSTNGLNTGTNGSIDVSSFFFSTTYYNTVDTKIINDGNIHHLIVEITNVNLISGTIKCYVDGELRITSTAQNAGAFNNIRGFGTGRPPNDGLGTHFGYVGHIAMYDKALTAAQKTNHYQLTQLRKPPNQMYFDPYVYKWMPAQGIVKANIDGTWSDPSTPRLV